jgi:hypothetical protein
MRRLPTNHDFLRGIGPKERHVLLSNPTGAGRFEPWAPDRGRMRRSVLRGAGVFPKADQEDVAGLKSDALLFGASLQLIRADTL